MLSLEMLSQPEILSPCNRLQFSAMALMDCSVMFLSFEMSKASSDGLFSTRAIRPESVRPRQFVRVNLSTLVHAAKGSTLPSLTLSARAARFNRFMKSR